MKKFNLLSTILMVFALFVAGCKEDTPIGPNNGGDNGGDNGGTQNPVELSFVASVLETTKTTATYSVTPSDLEANYLVFVYNAKAVEQCETDQQIVETLYAEVKAYAEANDTTLTAYLGEKVKKGALENEVISDLALNTNYYLLIFGVDTEKDMAATTDITKVRFKTKDATQTACTFEITPNVYLNTASLAITPSIKTQMWHLINVSADEYQTYTKADGEYGWSQEEFFLNYLNTEITTLKEKNYTEAEIKNRLFHTDVNTLHVANLTPKSKYTALVAGVDYSVDGAFITSMISEKRYNVGEAAPSDLSFDIEVFNIEHYSAEVRITPSDPNAEYFYHIGYIDNSKKDAKPYDIASAAVTESIYYWENYTELKHRDPVTGVVDLTGDNKLELNIAETEYYIVAFSFELNPTYGQVIDEETGEIDYNPGTITSAPTYVSFTTPEHGDPMNAEFEFSATDVGPYDFYFEVTAKDPTIYYQPGIAMAEGFDPQKAISQSSSLLAQLKEMCMTGQSPCLTFHEALEEKLQSYYRNGSGRYYVANLNPECNYIGYVLAIDVKTGTFARCIYSDIIATTTSVGSVDPTIEVLGVYNGNEEDGSIFGDAALTANRPIIAVEFNNIEEASALYCALSTDAYDDVVKLADNYIISEFRGYWQNVESLEVPYHFLIGDWDYDQTIVGYAQDANGNEGAVARLGIKPTSSNDIEELRGYVDEVNASITRALHKSLVIAEQTTPTMECIWSEEVGAPRSAEVTFHAAEPLATQNDVMNLGFVKQFHI